MNAKAVTSYLIEAEGETIFAFVPRLTSPYGVGAPPAPGEDPFATWSKAFIKKTPSMDPELAAQAKESPEDFVKMLVDQFDATFILVLGGETSVISRRRKARLPAEFLEKVRRFLGIQPHSRVGWFKGVDATPVETVAAEVIYGQEPEDVDFEKTRPKVEKPLTREQRADLRRKFWAGRTDPNSAPDIVDKLLQ